MTSSTFTTLISSSRQSTTMTPSAHSPPPSFSFAGVDEGEYVVNNFIKHYNTTTREVDLVFVIDRSGSVPDGGWGAIENFIMDILEHFTVDASNTRVAIVTFSSDATVDINDLELSDKENKCTLHRRIQELFRQHKPYGFTATYEALDKAYQILQNARMTSKKAIIVLTDGRSNVGPPPVRAAFRILSLNWDKAWNATVLGPQAEIYAFGIEDAYLPELKSIASAIPNHTFFVPTFQAFAEFARSLHGGVCASKMLSVVAKRVDVNC